MKKISSLLFVLATAITASLAQVVSTSPAFPTDSEPLTITFDAAQGNGALLCNTATVYMHTGVILQPNETAWQHVKGTWGTADATVAMTAIGNNKYTFTFPNGIRAFYGVLAGEMVYRQSFVFRNAAGTVVARAADGGDIFSPVYSGTTLETKFTNPPTASGIHNVGDAISFDGVASQTGALSILVDGNVVATAAANTALSYNYTIATAGNHRAAFACNTGTATDTVFYNFVAATSTTAAAPAGTTDGITHHSNTSVTLQLYAPNKQNVFLIGSMNNWLPQANYQLQKTPDGNHFWITLNNLVSGQKYTFQYLVDGKIKIADPYSEVILNKDDDPYIPAITYPNMPPYPTGKTTGNVTLLEMGATPYTWQATNYQRPDKRDIVIYELFISDFIARHDYQTLIDTLDYIQNLGINAIQLMPINEFEGNISWGYNVSMHGTVDKYYGTRDKLKMFIDECHSRGIAVIFDVVFNHAFSQSPLAQLYWDNCASKPLASNPWLNPDARHPFNVGSDFNHESQATKDYMDKIIKHWLQDYKVDGFRFDLSKGFTQNYTTDVGVWGNYDASRIVLLKRMANALRQTDPNAYIILEHFANNTEENELSNDGMMLWGNAVTPYNEATMGYIPTSNFAWNVSYKNRGWQQPNLVGYMESHDEERQMYKNLKYGNSFNPNYNLKDTVNALKRAELAGAFFFTVPGPKMIYQFEELGYNYSIFTCVNGTVSTTGGCRLDPKPIRWNFNNNPNRKQLYNTWRKLIYLKRTEPAFRSNDFTMSVSDTIKVIKINDPVTNIVVVGNFGIYGKNATPVFQNTGRWYEFFSGDSITVSDVNMQLNLARGEYRIYTSKRVLPVSTDSKGAGNAFDLAIYPNPAQGEVTIQYVLETKSQVLMDLYDMVGNKVMNLQNNTLPQGEHIGTLDASHLPAGTYFIRLTANNKTEVKKLILIK